MNGEYDPKYYDIVIDIIDKYFDDEDRNCLIKYIQPENELLEKIKDLELLSLSLRKRIKDIEDQL